MLSQHRGRRPLHRKLDLSASNGSSEQRAEFGVVNSHRKTTRENVLFGYIVDPDTGKIVAVIRYGGVFRHGREGARIAIVINSNLYDLNGNSVGRLDEQNMIDVRTWSMPVAFRNLLQGANVGATEALTA
jgi:hypothetical protein